MVKGTVRCQRRHLRTVLCFFPPLPSPAISYRPLPSPTSRRLMCNHDTLEPLRAVPRRIAVECRRGLLIGEDVGTDEFVLPRPDAVRGGDAGDRRRDRD